MCHRPFGAVSIAHCIALRHVHGAGDPFQPTLPFRRTLGSKPGPFKGPDVDGKFGLTIFSREIDPHIGFVQFHSFWASMQGKEHWRNCTFCCVCFVDAHLLLAIFCYRYRSPKAPLQSTRQNCKIGYLVKWTNIRRKLCRVCFSIFIELDDGKILTGKPDQFDGKNNHGFL